MITQFFANLWFMYFSSIKDGESKITSPGKSSFFLDGAWIFLSLLTYALHNPDLPETNSWKSILFFVGVGKILSPLILLPFAKQLFTTKERLLKGAYFVLIPSMILFLFARNRLVYNDEQLSQFEENIKLKLGVDKYAHFGISFFIFQYVELFFSLKITWAWVPAVVISVAVGILKEWYDKRNGGYWDNHDLIANALGIILGMIYLLF